MFPRLCVWVLIASPTLAFAASKEIQELQRDVAQLQQQVRDLQRSQDEKFAALQVLVQQAVDNASKANTAVAVIQSGFQQNIRDTESKVVAPVVGLSSRMDQVSNDLRTVQQAVSDVTGLMSKLQAQLTDLGNAVKVLCKRPRRPRRLKPLREGHPPRRKRLPYPPPISTPTPGGTCPAASWIWRSRSFRII